MWIQWPPNVAEGILRAITQRTGEDAALLWLVEPPPAILVACTGVTLDAVRHYTSRGGVPVGFVDNEGQGVHRLTLPPPFEPPGWSLLVDNRLVTNYATFAFTEAFLFELLTAVVEQSGLPPTAAA